MSREKIVDLPAECEIVRRHFQQCPSFGIRQTIEMLFYQQQGIDLFTMVGIHNYLLTTNKNQ
jgi:hypothetical protein